MKCEVYSRRFLCDIFCKRTFLFLTRSYQLLLVDELDSHLQINSCNRSVIWHTRNGLLPIMYALMATLLSLSSSQLQANQSGWFSSEENSCNDLMLLILSFTVHSEMLWVMLSIWCYKCPGVWSCTAPCLCSELLWKWWWDAGAPWAPFLFKVFPLHCFTEGFCTEGFFMCNSCSPVECMPLPASHLLFLFEFWGILYPVKHLPYSSQCLP